MLDILQQQFADTSIIEMYVSAYQEEQKRVRGDAFRQRAQAQKALDDAKASITKIVEKDVQGPDRRSYCPTHTAERERE
ncbi:Hypothetical protein NGAL_HAMBI1146_38150 [Neorhizobium galegae bv. officinalis]|uniref:hypothetical protein n=1 Tax=Neorhizobium galegae TaxID=399 RepID=UPI0006215BD6|nr:hypothetical protein [Neorhizobium galegae]MCQ1845008.1 hypothetical protein [Neorhizobium galegae]CDZ40334.1 Hypothetical protein NGAL_HAMBI1146_38150 [Neorhizobium galegae bv. officinalis]